ncbi:hypothetical protein [Cohnella faecalis]|uniref:Uncharacterized protein n=1 Tax=Cohnella faecalis TaxID=2315694 RepID=A0A398CNJ6_9BACL|nr:hypothetical protein [Cohnella faecalis]RIE01151.1 hypothetical protein D3H35_22350 [Cohnella faecalis]
MSTISFVAGEVASGFTLGDGDGKGVGFLLGVGSLLGDGSLLGVGFLLGAGSLLGAGFLLGAGSALGFPDGLGLASRLGLASGLELADSPGLASALGLGSSEALGLASGLEEASLVAVDGLPLLFALFLPEHALSKPPIKTAAIMTDINRIFMVYILLVVIGVCLTRVLRRALVRQCCS